jgi:DNA repair protein RadC
MKMEETIKTEVGTRYLLKTFTVQVVRDPHETDPHKMADSASVAKSARTFIPDDLREHFGVFCLNNKNRLIAYHEVSVGSLTASLVHPREVFRPVLLAGAAAMILCHNHPSGDPAPSTEDIDITKRLKECADVFGIRLLDHVIIGNGSDMFFSFNDKGLL